MTAIAPNVVVGIASLEGDDGLLDLGIRAAEALGATLHAVHAYALPEPILQPFAELEWLDPARAETYRRAVEARLAAHVAAHAPTVAVRCHAQPGPAAMVLTTIAEEVDARLVVVGATRRGTLSRTILGTTAQRVLRASRAPTLIVREPIAAVRRVLLTSDLSPLSAAVHCYGADLVGRLFGDVDLRSLLVVGYDVAAPPPLRRDLVHAAAQAEMAEFLAGCTAGPRPVEPVIRFGEPSSEIVACAAEWPTDLLVLGTHGRTGTQRFLLGSVAEATVRSALCSVLVVPAVTLGLAVQTGADTVVEQPAA